MRRALLVLSLLVVAACDAKPSTITIGKKAFVEQDLLAEIVAATIESSGAGATEIVDCGDTFACQQALRAGDIDLMVEYTGTGHLYSSASALGRTVDIDTLRASYEPLGLTWLDPLGFDNGYRVVMQTSRASVLGIASIDDLVKLDGGLLRVAAPPTYLRRPGDGLGALLSRHGLRTRSEPLAIADVEERVEALRQGRVDVAVLYATDGALQSSDLTVLDDSLGFFPPYEAAILARQDLFTGRAPVRAALDQLAGSLDADTMQRLNRDVQVQGWRPAVVAQRFLRERGLLGPAAAGAEARPVRVAVPSDDRLEAAIDRAIRAVRQSFADRPAAPMPVRDPLEALAQGRARLAVVGAERFFFRDPGGRLRRASGVEAVAVVGDRLAHLVRRRGDDAAPLSGRVGAPPEDSGAGVIADAILDGDVARRGPAGELLAAVTAGDLDAALIVAEPGDRSVASLLGPKLELRAVPVGDAAAATPFLRPARIAASTYPGQAEVVDTLGAQVVIAGPARAGTGAGFAGPAAALSGAPAPLTLAEAEALLRASGVAESPDPALPSAWTTWPAAASGDAARGPGGSLINTLANLFALGFLVWVLRLVGRRDLGKSLSAERR